MHITPWNRKPITRAGWYAGISLDQYHAPNICAGPAVSSTDLRTCWAKSPAHMQLQWAENPAREARSVTRPLILGSAAHHLLLGESNFKMRYVQQPATYRDKITAQEKSWHNGALYCKAWNAAQDKAGKTPITIGELASIVAMSRSLALEPLVNAGLLRGQIEVSGFWKDQETGLWIKVRPDVIPTASGDYVDLKTAQDVTTPALQSAIRSRAYHQQGALVWEVVEALEQPFESFVLMFIETSAPWCARTVPLTDEDLARGRQQNRAMLRRIASCIAANHFPGPGEGDLHPLPLANDERSRIDERLKREGIT
jgi:PDDEXK-like domain of unknown function (DUF3799)